MRLSRPASSLKAFRGCAGVVTASRKVVARFGEVEASRPTFCQASGGDLHLAAELVQGGESCLLHSLAPPLTNTGNGAVLSAECLGPDRFGRGRMSIWGVEFWRVVWVAGVLTAAALGWLLYKISPANAAGVPGWELTSNALPTNFAPGSSGDRYILTATDDGSGPTVGEVTVADQLPTGLTATSVTGYETDGDQPLSCVVTTVKCSSNEPLAPGDSLVIVITVDVSLDISVSVTTTASVSGGGAAVDGVATGPTPIAAANAPFGITEFQAHATNPNGTPDTQAGSRPYDAATSFSLASRGSNDNVTPSGAVKDVEVGLPAGFLGDPQSTPTCAQQDFDHTACPADSQVGQTTLILSAYDGAAVRLVLPVYNLTPTAGQTAEFGFDVLIDFQFPVVVTAKIRSAGRGATGDFGITTTISDIASGAHGTPAGLLSASLTFWGVPSDASHTPQRGLVCEEAKIGAGRVCTGGGQPSGAPEIPFLTNPTSCEGGPLRTTMSAESWEGGNSTATPALSPAPTGCNALTFSPLLDVTPEVLQSGEPSGYKVDVQVPQDTSPSGLATPELRNALVTLPAGVTISPSAANGLEGCSDGEIGIGTEDPVGCPSGSKIGTAKVTTPLLSGPLEGAVYVGEPLPNDPYRIFVVIEGFGLSIRLEGTVHADESTGQLTATFDNNPQLPFSDLQLHFFGGPEAALSNPSNCGTATTTSELTPWSGGPGGTPVANPSSSFNVSFDGHGAPCPPRPFAPAFSAGSQSTQAAAFSPFTLTLTRTDQDQDLEGITVHTPAGLLGMLSKVSLCPEPQAAQGVCGPESLIGSATIGSGPGPYPFLLGGKVYLTGSYRGAPFGLSVVVPAIAGPYNLGTVVVRAAINVDPSTAALTITSDPLPHILQGIPLQLRTINAAIDRPDFMFNPTDCTRTSVAAATASTEGASANVSSPFAAQGCGNLPFKPTLTASTEAETSDASGASLSVRVSSHFGQANIAGVDLQLPRQLPTRLTTLQKACTEAQFDANPAGCPPGSVIGKATAITPVLNVPLTGPAILVSHGGAAFPDVEFILQGQGVTIVLDGKTQIKKGITYSHFDTVPDAPVSSFEAVLPEGPDSILATDITTKTKDNLCGQKLTIPTTLVGQNGATLKQIAQVAVSGCPRANRQTKAQELAKALKECIKTPGGKRRAACDADARRSYRRNKANKASRKAVER
jgi:hypothetical protein